jgi:hypothetical protein
MQQNRDVPSPTATDTLNDRLMEELVADNKRLNRQVEQLMRETVAGASDCQVLFLSSEVVILIFFEDIVWRRIFD